MTQPQVPETPLDLDGLLARLKAEADRTDGRAEPTAPSQPPEHTAAKDDDLSVPGPAAVYEGIVLSPPPPLAEDLVPTAQQALAQQSIDDLLRFRGEVFLRHAYQAILGRDPDETGVLTYREDVVAPGGRAWVAASLLWSAEARARRSRINGLGWVRALRWMPGKRLLRPLLARQERRRCRRPAVAAAMEVQALSQRVDEVLRQMHEASIRSHALIGKGDEHTRDFLQRAIERRLQRSARELELRFDGIAAQDRDHRQQFTEFQTRTGQLSDEISSLSVQLSSLETQTREQRARQAEAETRQRQNAVALTENANRLAEHAERLDSVAARVEWIHGHDSGRMEQINAQIAELRAAETSLAERALHLERESDRLRGFTEFLGQRLGDPADGFEKRIERIASDSERGDDDLRERLGRLSRDFDFSRADVIYHRARVHDVLRRLDALGVTVPLVGQEPSPPAPSAESNAAHITDALHQISVDHASDALDAFYVAFEDSFRGDRGQIRAGLVHYLDDVAACGTVATATPLLDLGCGRGEWLELLREHDYAARGVDLNRVAVEQCRGVGLAVTHADVLDSLSTCADAGLGAISAFHIIEHLPFDRLLELLQQCYRKLSPGGLLLLETPNPENLLVGSHTFYHDPTHRNPLTPTATAFLVRYCGFSDPEIRRLHPYPESARVAGDDPLTARVNGHLCGPQDFAVIAHKPRGGR